MKNRKIAVFLAVCLGTVFFSGCGSDMKNYRQASSDLEAEKYDEALQEFETAIASGRLLQRGRSGECASWKL